MCTSLNKGPVPRLKDTFAQLAGPVDSVVTGFRAPQNPRQQHLGAITGLAGFPAALLSPVHLFRVKSKAPVETLLVERVVGDQTGGPGRQQGQSHVPYWYSKS